MRINLSEETVLSSKDVLEVIFPNPKSRKAANVFLEWLKAREGRATKTDVSSFADHLEQGAFKEGERAFRYSRRNFYTTILRTLLQLGFLRKNVPLWDDRLKKTLYVYYLNFFDIPRKPPSVGFWRIAYYLCRKWNERFGVP